MHDDATQIAVIASTSGRHEEKSIFLGLKVYLPMCCLPQQSLSCSKKNYREHFVCRLYIYLASEIFHTAPFFRGIKNPLSCDKKKPASQKCRSHQQRRNAQKSPENLPFQSVWSRMPTILGAFAFCLEIAENPKKKSGLVFA